MTEESKAGLPKTPWGQPPSEPATTVELLWRLMRYAKPYLPVLAIVVILMVGFAGGRFGRAYLMKPLMDEVLIPFQSASSEGLSEDAGGGLIPGLPQIALDRTGGEPSEAGGTPISESSEADQKKSNAEIRAEAAEALKRIALIAIGIVILVPLVMAARVYAMHWVQKHIAMDMRRELAAKLMVMPLAFHRRAQSGDLLSRALSDANSAQGGLTLVFGQFLLAVVTILVGASMLLYISWQLALISFVMAPASIAVLAYFSGRIRKTARRRQSQLGEVTHHLVAILSGIKVIKAFRGEDLENAAFRKKTWTLYRRSMKVVKNRVLSRSLVEFFNNGVSVSMLIVAAYLVMQGRWELTIGAVAAFATGLATIYKPIKTLSKGWAALADHLASAERYFELLDAEEEPADAADAIAIDGIREGIRFRDVGFSYGDTPVLQKVNLDIHPGEVLAVVGRTGEGKTTLVDLLLRFYDVDTGSIEIDGVDLRQITRHSFLDQVAMVTQEPFLFDATIHENITYGRPDASAEEIASAAKAAHIDEFIDQLAEGYDTQVGEFGARLSGGQRQRITIARAILKNPPLLVFDEATSSLDAKTERTVQDAIDSLRGHRTIVIVAHRLSTIRRADRIVVLEHGRVAQVGSHDELMAQGGFYRELVSLQSDSENTPNEGAA